MSPIKISPTLILLACLLFWQISQQFLLALTWGHDSFQMTECLINYSGGFVRRGLLGSVAMTLSEWVGIQANQLVVLSGFLFYFLLLGWLLIKATRVFPAALILSCLIMGFPAYQDCIVRKDCLGLLLFLACLKVDASHLPRVGAFLMINLLAAAAILAHEAFAFYALPALVLCGARDSASFSPIVLLQRTLSVLPSIGVFLLTTYYHGTPQIANAVNKSWLPLWRIIDPAKVGLEQPSGAIQALGWTSQEGMGPGLNLLTSGFYQPTIWAVLFAISFAIIVLFANRDTIQDAIPMMKEKIRIAALLLMQFVFISPLFVLGHDYGRWLFFWAASALILHTTQRKTPRWVESFVAQGFGKAKISHYIRNIRARDWYLLFFGIPVCWNIPSFLIASPLARHSQFLWSWLRLH